MKKTKIHISEERHNCDLESLGNVFMPIVKGVLSAEDFVEADVILRWVEIVGETISSFCNPLKTRFNPKDNKRTLYVEVPAGGFALELRHKENYILEKINSYFGYKAIHQLNIAQNVNMKLRNKMLKNKESVEEKLSEDEQKYLSDLTNDIKDEKLREILIKLGKSVIVSNRE